jgi:hypothetical protein
MGIDKSDKTPSSSRPNYDRPIYHASRKRGLLPAFYKPFESVWITQITEAPGFAMSNLDAVEVFPTRRRRQRTDIEECGKATTNFKFNS